MRNRQLSWELNSFLNSVICFSYAGVNRPLLIKRFYDAHVPVTLTNADNSNQSLSEWEERTRMWVCGRNGRGEMNGGIFIAMCHIFKLVNTILKGCCIDCCIHIIWQNIILETCRHKWTSRSCGKTTGAHCALYSMCIVQYAHCTVCALYSMCIVQYAHCIVCAL